MARPRKLRIAGYPVERVSVGRHTLGVIEVRDGITVIVPLLGDRPGTGGGGIDADCLVCKIGKINECADEVCPEIKAEDPNASCADAITACTERKCADRCGGGFGSSFGRMIVIA
jgi:hypothetical protein